MQHAGSAGGRPREFKQVRALVVRIVVASSPGLSYFR